MIINSTNLAYKCYRTNLFSVKRTISFFLPLSQILSIWPALFLPLFLSNFISVYLIIGSSFMRLTECNLEIKRVLFLSFFLALSDWKRTNRKERVNKDKEWKKWNDAEISVAFSAQKPPFYAVLLRFVSALAKLMCNRKKMKKKKRISYGFPVHLELPVHP